MRDLAPDWSTFSNLPGFCPDLQILSPPCQRRSASVRTRSAGQDRPGEDGGRAHILGGHRLKVQEVLVGRGVLWAPADLLQDLPENKSCDQHKHAHTSFSGADGGGTFRPLAPGLPGVPGAPCGPGGP